MPKMRVRSSFPDFKSVIFDAETRKDEVERFARAQWRVFFAVSFITCIYEYLLYLFDQAWAGGCQACFFIVLILSDPH